MDTPISSERANSKKMMEEDDVLLFTDNKVARSGLPVPSKDENDWNDETEPPDMQEGFHSMSRHAVPGSDEAWGVPPEEDLLDDPFAHLRTMGPQEEVFEAEQQSTKAYSKFQPAYATQRVTRPIVDPSPAPSVENDRQLSLSSSVRCPSRRGSSEDEHEEVRLTWRDREYIQKTLYIFSRSPQLLPSTSKRLSCCMCVTVLTLVVQQEVRLLVCCKLGMQEVEVSDSYDQTAGTAQHIAPLAT
eukprot:1156679-Rhodomonas_salina.2